MASVSERAVSDLQSALEAVRGQDGAREPTLAAIQAAIFDLAPRAILAIAECLESAKPDVRLDAVRAWIRIENLLRQERRDGVLLPALAGDERTVVLDVKISRLDKPKLVSLPSRLPTIEVPAV